MKKYAYYLSIFTLLVTIISCEDSKKSATKGKPYIVTTTGMIADIVENIAGDSATVEAIMQPGVDPHLYKASQGDLKKIMDADYIFYNGLHLEGKMGEILEKQTHVKPVIALGDSITVSKVLKVSESTYDPHIWFDVVLWKEAAEVTLRSLMKLNPENTAYYQQNADRYLKELDELDQWVKKEISTIPKNRRVLITAHDAFSYFGKAYGIEVRGLQGISTMSEIGLRDVTDLVNYIIKNDIPAVFVESSVSDKSLKAVVEGVNNKGKKLTIGGNLFSDAMGAKGTPEGTYIGMVKHNVNTIVTALKK
ncbi:MULTISPECIES: metal ABC transporter solute-binding protein, Zn/Mn family [Bacteroidota]|jgi:manganese/zinc/iron transport system substrate-binding protein|uniref:Manganese/zinc/iron transport system substrate-binding protein n=3 Tax=Sphingobacterium TaxID=28453 RepID=A0A1X7J7A3_9SPHI|nr:MULTISPECIES: zinc ABC transporter substrate-binding protein [Bacteroidota]EHM7981304.1 zinc ABC transporter substrate-binding protein [Elizabethkingia anophelis]EHM8032907.1 zinc ABC transporter substrate-binding protein [Elizabethkingia anophelis]EHM8034250.1 zinc ABC transporter substrate-binding protein [Elizabethkingia anophelis]EHZ9535926.1 zinc ABC transporter substrate-binding protein [Elizabethkingia anophelis]EKU3673835.1 zinc ABC transporter substrate-binding protein [Elizabethki